MNCEHMAKGGFGAWDESIARVYIFCVCYDGHDRESLRRDLSCSAWKKKCTRTVPGVPHPDASSQHYASARPTEHQARKEGKAKVGGSVAIVMGERQVVQAG